MKSLSSLHRWWGGYAKRLLTTMLVLFAIRADMVAQSALAPMASGKFLQLRITDYDFSTSRNGNPYSVNRSWLTGAELIYEKVKEDGRGTRLLLGWIVDAGNSKSISSGGFTTLGNSAQHRFRIGWGKSQTYLWKRLVMRGGMDNYFQFDRGLRYASTTRDASGVVTISNYLRYAPSFQFALRPFLGLGLQVSPRFAVGIESGLLLSLDAVVGNKRTTSYRPAFGTNDTRSGAFSLVLDVRPSSTLPFVVLTYQF